MRRILVILLVAAFVGIGVMAYQQSEDRMNEIEQMKNKIDQLEQENRQLHDDVWVLNQELMKMEN